jgi:hypothetical protein
MPLLRVKMPGNVLEVFKGFSDIVNMKFFDQQAVFDMIFEKAEIGYEGAISLFADEPGETNSTMSNSTDTSRKLEEEQLASEMA